MQTQFHELIMRLAFVGACVTSNLSLASEVFEAEGQLPNPVAPAVTASNLNQLKKPPAETGRQRASLSDIQLAELIVREEKALLQRQKLGKASGEADARSADDVAEDKRMADELSKAASSEERDIVIARSRAYRRVAARMGSAATVDEAKPN